MIIYRDLMVQLALTADFKRQVLQWDFTTILAKEPSGLIGKPYLSQWEMWEVVMETSEPASTIEATEMLVKILDTYYVKADLKQVADNKNQMNYE